MSGGQICVVVPGRVPGVQSGLGTLQPGLGVGDWFKLGALTPEHLGYQSTWTGIWGFFVVHFFLIWKWEGLGCS